MRAWPPRSCADSAAGDHGHPAGRRRAALKQATVATVNLGTSGGRVMTGRVGDGTLRLEEVHRFGNEPVRVLGTLHWDIRYADVLDGLRSAARAADQHRHRLLGRGLRPARPGRGAAGQPGALPRRRLLPGPLDRPGREVDGIDAASQAGQVGGVPPDSAVQFERPSPGQAGRCRTTRPGSRRASPPRTGTAWRGQRRTRPTSPRPGPPPGRRAWLAHHRRCG